MLHQSLEMYPSLLAVIFTSLDESTFTPPGLATVRIMLDPGALFTSDTPFDMLEDTGVITSLGGGVFGLGGRSVTFTSIGAMREPSNGLCS
jgi:hypothetical protein